MTRGFELRVRERSDGARYMTLVGSLVTDGPAVLDELGDRLHEAARVAEDSGSWVARHADPSIRSPSPRTDSAEIPPGHRQPARRYANVISDIRRARARRRMAGRHEGGGSASAPVATDKALVWLYGEVRTPPFSTEARREVGYLLRLLQQGEALSMPHSRPMFSSIGG